MTVNPGVADIVGVAEIVCVTAGVLLIVGVGVGQIQLPEGLAVASPQDTVTFKAHIV